MRKKRYLACLLALCLLLTACGGPSGGGQSETEAPPAETEEPSLPNDGQPEEGETPPAEAEIPTEPEMPEESEAPETGEKPQPPQPPREEPLTKEDIQQRLTEAMTALEPEVQLNVSGMEWQFGAENDLKNIYYAILSEHPELKYTYDLEPSLSGDTAVCVFRYMPYKTGAYAGGLPAGSHTVASLHDAEVMAQGMNSGTQRLSIAITDPDLAVEDIQRALGQAGYGWIRYDLSRDGTEIVATAPVGKDLSACAEAINESFRLGGEVLARTLTDGMTDREKARALYDDLVGRVAYDFRYYSDPAHMPYESTVALGALRDDLAICGGYAHAFETLLDMAGIENYTVTGISKGEHHMWNYVVLEGQGYYCDPTADRGGMGNHFLLTADELTALGGYTWDRTAVETLSG